MFSFQAFAVIGTGRVEERTVESRRVSMLNLVDCNDERVESSKESEELVRGWMVIYCFGKTKGNELFSKRMCRMFCNVNRCQLNVT